MVLNKIKKTKNICDETLDYTLIIVESFSKCIKIEEYLGKCYKCIACGGHIRELKKLKNIDIENGFDVKYDIIRTKFVKENIKNMKYHISNASEILLATDDDREGEAIAWHICKVFKLDIYKTKRIKFNEITQHSILNAVQNPNTINMNMVFSQQTRQIIDLLIGYKISPILWQYFTYNKSNLLSAGRCQTPALNLIYDNHVNIIKKESDDSTTYYTHGCFSLYDIIYTLDTQFNTYEQSNDFLLNSKDFKHIIHKYPIVNKYKSPPLPLNTSSLQQRANIELNLSPKTTMNICQKLYENGYITYHRTDSKRFNKDFINNTIKLITLKYGPDYVHNNIVDISTNNKNIKNSNKIQDAHESIRPTNINIKNISNRPPIEIKMYKLIYTITLQSCMSKSLFYSLKTQISAPDKLCYTNELEQYYFLGWEILLNKDKSNEKYIYMNRITNDTCINVNSIEINEKKNNIGTHYSEASLIKKLEYIGIGRPSTYSSIVDKIQQRGYVTRQNIDGVEIDCDKLYLDFSMKTKNIIHSIIQNKFGSEKNKLIITQQGYLVMFFLYKYYNDIFNYEYTKNMEIDIDLISNGIKSLSEVCNICNNTLITLTDINKQPKFNIKLGDNHEYIMGKYGPIIKQSDSNIFLQANDITKLNINVLYSGGYTLDDLLNTTPIIKNTENTIDFGIYKDKTLILKKGKYGLYIVYGPISLSMKCLGNRPICNIKYNEIIKHIDLKEKYIENKINKLK
jgi:DNA topoisomerase-1